MRLLRWLFLSVLVGFFASCTHNTSTAGGGSHPRNTGPFDRNGNYVESWVSQPSRWGGTATPTEITPTIVKRNDEDARDRRRAPEIKSRSSSSSRATASRGGSSSTAKRSSSRNDDDDKPTKRSSSSSSSRSATAKNTTTKSSSTKSSSTKPKSSSSSKTASSRYTVKKGDSLAVIAKRNGTTVAKLKAANGISGTTIRPGQALKVPK